MKKISFLMALAVFIGTCFTSCKQYTQPRLEKPTEFVLNVPPMAEQTYILSPEHGVDLTVSQPDYGMGVVTSYQTQISFTEDFARYESIEAVSNQAKINIAGEMMAQAMCKLMGYVSNDTEDMYSSEARDVYVRVRAYIPNASYSEITSNVIKLMIQPYKAVKLPGRLYVIGDVSGWDINNGAVYLEEPANAVGGKVYIGVVPMTAAQAAGGFRFYETLGNWGDNGALPSIGANADDGDNLSCAVDENGVYSGSCVTGKGNWNITNWQDGDMKMTVDLNSMKVIFEKAS